MTGMCCFDAKDMSASNQTFVVIFDSRIHPYISSSYFESNDNIVGLVNSKNRNIIMIHYNLYHNIM